MNIKAGFNCSRCGKQIERGDFMAILGEAPGTGVSLPIGRADKLIADIGEIYCKACLHEVIDEPVSARE